MCVQAVSSRSPAIRTSARRGRNRLHITIEILPSYWRMSMAYVRKIDLRGRESSNKARKTVQFGANGRCLNSSFMPSIPKMHHGWLRWSMRNSMSVAAEIKTSHSGTHSFRPPRLAAGPPRDRVKLSGSIGPCREALLLSGVSDANAARGEELPRPR